MAAMDILIAQSIIDEMAKEHNLLIDYYAGLVLPPPGSDLWNATGREQYATELCLATWRDAMKIVARQAGIKLDLTPVKAERKKRK